MSSRLLHVAIVDDWEACARFGEYTVSTRRTSFEEAGYIHAATASQLSTVLDEVYGDLNLPLVLAVIDEEGLAAEGIEVQWESSTHPHQDSSVVPRILGPLPMEEPIIVAEISLHRSNDRWELPDLTELHVRDNPPAS